MPDVSRLPEAILWSSAWRCTCCRRELRMPEGEAPDGWDRERSMCGRCVMRQQIRAKYKRGKSGGSERSQDSVRSLAREYNLSRVIIRRILRERPCG